ncbi:MAG: hypothetical protein CVU97_02985 [Firmicutes bacterium HGW-Firmicutes-21]|nr:MAG: hypothetical protein CVU97_02985 [Firmicutes bacterium HGW-Firmicutes-21]
MSNIYLAKDLDNSIDDIYIGPYHAVDKVGGYIYRSRESLLGYDVPIKDHIKCMLELCAGAHYYAHSVYSDLYTESSTLIDLNELKIRRVDSEGNPCRNAYLCLGYVAGGKYWHMDTGLANNAEEDYWRAFSWGSHYGKPDNFSNEDVNAFNTKNYPNARYFKNTFRISGTDKEDTVNCIYEFLDENESLIASMNLEFKRGYEEIFTRSENGKPMLRFTRFISMVPRSGKLSDDNADDTYLIGVMRELRLDGTPWTEDRLDYVWSVQGANILDLQISGLSDNPVGEDIDYINIFHRYQLN